jgi:hypothetical protein
MVSPVHGKLRRGQAEIPLVHPVQFSPASSFRALPHPPTGEGLLLQSMTDSNLYYSFGPWDSAEDIAAMREDTKAKAAIKRVMACCDEATPGGYRVIAKA